MPLIAPWNHIEETLAGLQDFDMGAQRLSDFFKGKEEKHSPDELMELFLQGNPPQKILERLLFFLLDIGVPDRQTGSRALQMHRIKRLWKRIARGSALTDTEHELADKTEWLFGEEAGGAEKVEAGIQAARDSFKRVLDGETLPEAERTTLVNLIRSEAEGLRDRVNWLSENTDPYNLKTMARILPRLRIYDEAVHEGLDLARRQEDGEPVGLKILSFEAHMKESVFEKWLKKVAKKESLARLAGLIEIQRVKKIPTMDLIALTTLSRWTWEAVNEKSEPLDWIEKAMASYQDGIFTVDAGSSARILMPALTGSGAKLAGTKITGNFGLKSFPAWVGRDLLSKSFLKGVDEGSLDIKAVITQNITRDSILEALLTNPKVFQKPGLVAFIAATSRSIGLLSKIAKTRALHSGFANRDVPLALLQSPCNIPVSLLKPFINVRNVPLFDLKHLARAKAGIRRQVKDEAELYLKSRT
ncbi:MAG: hypothetical protein JWP91_1891 [Fibrobacteres bacterium]|nr:hypothetical protein [Fibrobacterota bacterium]